MGDGDLGGGTAYGVAADGGDDGFADAGDVLPGSEKLFRVHLGNFPSLKRQRLKTELLLLSLRTGLVLHLLNIGASCLVCWWCRTNDAKGYPCTYLQRPVRSQ